MTSRTAVLSLLIFASGFWISAWILGSRLATRRDNVAAPSSNESEHLALSSSTIRGDSTSESEAPVSQVPARLTWVDPSAGSTFEVGDPSNLETPPSAPPASDGTLSDSEEESILKALASVDRSSWIRPSIPIHRLGNSTSRETMEVLMATMELDGVYRYECIEALCAMYSRAGFDEIPAFFDERFGSLDPANLVVLLVRFPKPTLLPSTYSSALLNENARVRAAALGRVKEDPALYQLAPGPIGHALELEGNSSLASAVLRALSRGR